MAKRTILTEEGVISIDNAALIDADALRKAVTFIKANVSKEIYKKLKEDYQFNMHILG